MGTVSYGTMRPQDLIPAFLDELSERDPISYAQIVVNGGGVPAYVYDEGDDSDWWCSDAAGFLIEELFDLLSNAAPEGYYFGAHPGDGSDYGYWRCDDDDDDDDDAR